MSSEQAKDLRQRGIAAVKAGQQDQGRTLLQQSLRLDPTSEAAWVWLASISRNQRERVFCLQKLLEINPNNETALKVLRHLGLTQEQLFAGQMPADDESSQTGTPAGPVVGVPTPDAQRIAQAQQQVDTILREYRLAPDKIEQVEWVRKTRRRAGERDSLYLRIAVVGSAAGILVILGIIGAIILATNPEAQRTVFGSSATPSFTPSTTPTNTPGFTPTPSPTPALTLTPSPTIPAAIHQGSIDTPPEPTRIYPEVSSRFIQDAVSLINYGQFAQALPTLVREREATEFSFNPSPYYYEALALLEADEPQSALARIQEAESRLEETPNQNFKPLVDLGYAQVFYYLAQAAFEDGATAQVQAYLDQLEERAETALEGDPRLADAYLLLARRYTLIHRYTDALGVLNEALGRPELQSNVSLIVERGEIYYTQGELNEAAQQAFLALYIDPTIESAYLLQIKTALTQGDPGLAVIYAQNYLYFYPGSAAGYKLLGDARVAEGNPDLALAAYNQALAAEAVTPATVDTLLARAKLYSQQGHYEQARNDLNRAYTLTTNPEIRVQRMEAAYLAGNYATVLEDAEALLGSGAVSDHEIQMLRARVLVDQAEDDADYTEALSLLNQVSATGDMAAIADEYRARAQYALGDYNSALSSVEAALGRDETGSRRFLRGEILEGLNRDAEALRDYEWVLAWGEIYPYPFLPEARRRYDSLTS